MKTIRSLIAAVLALLFVCASPARAATLRRGDADGDGSVGAADARLALRAAVGLETLEGAALLAADVDKEAGVTAADARLILRAAVELETLDGTVHVHEAGTPLRQVTKEPTCTERGAYREVTRCRECGQVLSDVSGEISKTVHAPEPLRIALSNGAPALICRCRNCGRNGINYTALRISVGYRGKTTPAYTAMVNAMLNSVKTSGGSFVRLQTDTHEIRRPAAAFEITDGLRQVFREIDGEGGLLPTTQAEYERLLGAATGQGNTSQTSLSSPTPVNRVTFPLQNRAEVSLLQTEDIAGVSLEAVTGCDFASELPAAFENARFIGIRPDNGAVFYTGSGALETASAFSSLLPASGDLLKLTVELSEESFPADPKTPPVCALDRIADVSSYDLLLPPLSGAARPLSELGRTELTQSGTIRTRGTLRFYFHADTLRPAAAVYDLRITGEDDFSFSLNAGDEFLRASADFKTDANTLSCYAFVS